MKNLNKNPIVWFLVAMVLGWWAIKTNNFEFFVVFISAVILAKQIEKLSK